MRISDWSSYVCSSDLGLGWGVGASFVNNRARQDREYGYGPLRAVLPGVTNRITEVTGYAEATVEIMPDLIAAGGLRLSHARLGGEAEGVSFALAEAKRAATASRHETDLLPTLSLLATPPHNVRGYARSPEVFRPGGLHVDGHFRRGNRKTDEKG